MKGNVSRVGFREDRHYSGVFQIQGALVTDADLGEQASISRSRTDFLGLDTAGSGVPAANGVVDLTGASPKLRPGTVYAEGVRGLVRATKAVPSALSLYDAQEDFPKAPELPANGDFFLYADVWERTVTNLEDPLISDAGFHGAETALRQRTIAQLKFAPLAELGQLGADDGPLPRQGSGVLKVSPVDPQVIADNCDPCADTVSAEQTFANALYRIEVVHVHGDPRAPAQIVVAWSAENAAAVASKNVNAEDFERAGRVYEAFSPITEMHLGVHQANGDVARSTFIDNVQDVPNPATGPDGQAWPFVRRWDGKAEVDFSAGTASVSGTGGVAVNGRVVTITPGTLTAELNFDNKAIVAGDFWLIETRRFANDPIRVVSETPAGIRHHFCPLLRIKDRAVEALDDSERRRVSFPTLPDIPASHVGFDNQCPKIFDGAANVQDALAALCGLSAEQIAFDPTHCTHLYDDVSNVQAALDNLCKVDFGIERYLRLMQDWGVVCGVIPRRVSQNQVGWSGGAILDRAGTLGDVQDANVKLSDIVDGGGLQFPNTNALNTALGAGEACLALTIEAGGVIKPHLVPKNRAFGPSDPTFMGEYTSCRDVRGPFDFPKYAEAVAETKKGTIDKVHYAATSNAIAGAQMLSATEEKVASKYTTDLLAAYKQHIGDDPLAGVLDQRVTKIDTEIRPQDESGQLRGILALKNIATKYAVIRETEEERMRRCLCSALMPRCPADSKPPNFVPIACLTGAADGQNIRIDEVCAYCCRKQAMTWRTAQYFLAELRDNVAGDLEKYCCHQKPGTTKPGVRPVDKIFDRMLKPDFTPQMYAEAVTRSLSFLGGDIPPTKYTVDPPRDLGVDEARTTLAGQGVEVVDTIPAGDRDAIDKLRAKSSVDSVNLVRGDRSVSPGDKVAVITENGIAVDYVKLEIGGGRNLFDQPAATAAVPDVDFRAKADEALAGFDEKLAGKMTELESAGAGLEEELSKRREEIAAANADLQKMGESRAGVAAEVESLRNDLTRLRTERESIAADISTAAGELDRVRAVHDDLNREVEGVKAELTTIVELQRTTMADAASEREKLVESIRRETPVTAVVGNEASFGNALVNRGVTNVGGLAGLADTDLEAVARESGLNLTTARRLRREADARIGAPIR